METHYPPVGFHFRVHFDLDGLQDQDTRFQEVTGLAAELGIEEVAEGGENRFSHRLPTRGRYTNLVLKRGLLVDSGLVQWCKDAIENQIFEPTTVDVTLLNDTHEPLGDTFSYQRCWPVKWAVSDYKAQENAIVIETLELAYSFYRRVSP